MNPPIAIFLVYECTKKLEIYSTAKIEFYEVPFLGYKRVRYVGVVKS